MARSQQPRGQPRRSRRVAQQQREGQDAEARPQGQVEQVPVYRIQESTRAFLRDVPLSRPVRPMRERYVRRMAEDVAAFIVEVVQDTQEVQAEVRDLRAGLIALTRIVAGDAADVEESSEEGSEAGGEPGSIPSSANSAGPVSD